MYFLSILCYSNAFKAFQNYPTLIRQPYSPQTNPPCRATNLSRISPQYRHIRAAGTQRSGSPSLSRMHRSLMRRRRQRKRTSSRSPAGPSTSASPHSPAPIFERKQHRRYPWPTTHAPDRTQPPAQFPTLLTLLPRARLCNPPYMLRMRPPKSPMPPTPRSDLV